MTGSTCNRASSPILNYCASSIFCLAGGIREVHCSAGYYRLIACLTETRSARLGSQLRWRWTGSNIGAPTPFVSGVRYLPASPVLQAGVATARSAGTSFAIAALRSLVLKGRSRMSTSSAGSCFNSAFWRSFQYSHGRSVVRIVRRFEFHARRPNPYANSTIAY